MSVRTATFRILVIAAPKPPEPPFVGVALDIEIDAGHLTWGVADVTPAAGGAAVVDWGDGSVEVASAKSATHEYSLPGHYRVRITGVAEFAATGPNAPFVGFGAAVRSVAINDPQLTRLKPYTFWRCTNLVRADVSAAGITSMMARAFAECPSLTGTIRLPHVVAIAGKGEYLPFAGSPGLREVHFAAANEAAIRALVSFKDDPLLGAPNAVVAFDL